jgi:hypothetical protein
MKKADFHFFSGFTCGQYTTLLNKVIVHIHLKSFSVLQVLESFPHVEIQSHTNSQEKEILIKAHIFAWNFFVLLIETGIENLEK